MTDLLTRKGLLGGLVLLLLLITFWCYRQGFTADFYFDDSRSISGVSQVTDLPGALAYMFDGKAGPAGRPMALGTFLLQKSSWPDHPEHFFLVNTFIHLVNGLLVFWFSVRLAMFFPERIRQPGWFGLATMALWLTLPLHVSASMMVVQRMATLSATFMLLGFIGYLSGRAILLTAPRKAYWRMSLSVMMGTLLATLSKESGALLPFYVLVLELCLIRTAGAPVTPGMIRWVWIFLAPPFFILIAYFAYRWPSFMHAYSYRSFSMAERLMTEPRILWEYFQHILLPGREGIGPYHDGYPVSRGFLQPVTTLLSILAWIAMCIAGWRLRKRYPAVLFGVLWFLAGHSLEATVVPLELYFEHRNYVAAIGPLLALLMLLWQVPVGLKRVAQGAVVLMIFLRIFVLSEVAYIWGQPLLAAQIWVDEHPYSTRAVLSLAAKLSETGQTEQMKRVIQEGYERINNDTGLALYILYTNCGVVSDEKYKQLISEIEPILESGELSTNFSMLLRAMLQLQQNGLCSGLGIDDLMRFAIMLEQNPKYQALSRGMVDIYFFKSKIYRMTGNQQAVLDEALKAYDLMKEYPIANSVALAMARVGRKDEALVFLQRAMEHAPANPLVRQKWSSEIERARLQIINMP